ncbi:hypothetical protein CONPUDRAFT_75968 [Coniophora puteana RWD-64-598 SS2]|uniref:Uncharacterized protein n=1 Tax=Coniophora puteana (strain RWD-64-598) TaxID=741705 RepID=A0A5M3MDI8_CONPW|nr:uncharacterized protein CONPUDRAFT_75968 [Coniophora puteana RWD-64-598 SS2]EIW77183.1 hypothetical protein CONPUDRAFT_75968 [Coniophora puteana RWD-64-598 SS2]
MAATQAIRCLLLRGTDKPDDIHQLCKNNTTQWQKLDDTLTGLPVTVSQYNELFVNLWVKHPLHAIYFMHHLIGRKDSKKPDFLHKALDESEAPALIARMLREGDFVSITAQWMQADWPDVIKNIFEESEHFRNKVIQNGGQGLLSCSAGKLTHPGAKHRRKHRLEGIKNIRLISASLGDEEMQKLLNNDKSNWIKDLVCKAKSGHRHIISSLSHLSDIKPVREAMLPEIRDLVGELLETKDFENGDINIHSSLRLLTALVHDGLGGANGAEDSIC